MLACIVRQDIDGSLIQASQYKLIILQLGINVVTTILEATMARYSINTLVWRRMSWLW